MPSSSLVELEVDVEVKVGVEVETELTRGQSSGKTLAPLDPGCIEDTMYFLELRIENM